ncbi:TPA: zinc-binding alcohol dehydrogenase family protein [Legionella pneumophila]|jgi:zinc-binding alcohol dehydrogenase family protein|uniref:Zinc-type alcohol dehydrogenase-like protein n=1 Tax=Legionella pneumophila TaxID=446 RepID=A0AAN5P3S5_LEGPN|nr:zinc-binding alcohol dehydrogenase family protein [Legionella pneumophila]HAT1596104.1 zinc-binding alcohol dehydrogenase family protein [Legionella pneumophila]HAT1972579.1 zinc-binding alcohol dehydrogenase family protein [Legionella pneumophila]HAT3975395.1 zinc-binding alcohol dehydrogenase family protein [Legionella pneumophila]HAT6957277.1 zinc-binding alcohol dehydrogenase family protein [Legionella pneumophila]HAT8356741.1 zinc-binding alcohol dehydrogenase family protein [Legionell
MKAIGYYQSLPITDNNALMDLDVSVPKATGHDILVEIKAVAVNPVDTKVRRNVQPEPHQPKILGWDASGVVTEIGSEVTMFKPGDEVWYAGDLTRPGSNCEFHLVDERIAAKKPKSLSFREAAALPLTSLTAWELLFDRLQLSAEDKGVLLITGAAGGVGSILVQLARQLTQLTIIGTAARSESIQWIMDNGAHHVIDHTKDMKAQLQNLHYSEVDYVISLTHTDQHAKSLVEILKPQGKFALIDDPQDLDIKLFKLKSISIHWEMMYTRSMFKTPDMIKQHDILTEVARLVDAGKIKTTIAECLGSINAENLRRAHALLESGTSRGKIVLNGF